MENTKLKVKVVVNGVPTSLEVHPKEKVSVLERHALDEAGQRHAKLEDWELKTETGTIIPRTETVEEAKIESGATLFLNRSEGGGG
jgi:Protein of Unknown function (DUF2604)